MYKAPWYAIARSRLAISVVASALGFVWSHDDLRPGQACEIHAAGPRPGLSAGKPSGTASQRWDR